MLIFGTFRRALENKTREGTHLESYTVIALSILRYGSESWTIRTSDIKSTQTVEMGCLRTVKGWTKLDHTENEDLSYQLKI
jgi:hypothetical protein